MPNWAQTDYLIYGENKDSLITIRNILGKVQSLQDGWIGFIHAWLYPDCITIDNLNKGQFLEPPIPGQRGFIENLDSEDSIYVKEANGNKYYAFALHVSDAWGAHPEIIAALCHEHGVNFTYICEEPGMGIYESFDPEHVNAPEFKVSYCDAEGDVYWDEYGTEPDDVLSILARQQEYPDLFKWLRDRVPKVAEWYEDEDKHITVDDIQPILDIINEEYLTEDNTYEITWAQSINDIEWEVDIPAPYNNCVEKWFLEKCPDDQKPVIYKEDLTEAVRQNLKEMGYTLYTQTINAPQPNTAG